MNPEDIVLQDLADKIGSWATQTFPHATPTSICEHMSREVKELLDNPHDVEEAADVMLLILHLAYRNNWNLGKAIRDKSSKNKSRVWGPPDDKGVSEHIKTSKEKRQK